MDDNNSSRDLEIERENKLQNIADALGFCSDATQEKIAKIIVASGKSINKNHVQDRTRHERDTLVKCA